MFQSLKQLHEELLQCTGCSLAKTRNRVIPGEGPADTSIVLLGEAPGGHEDVVSGKAFTGEAGQNLAGFLETLGLTRKQIYLTNTVKCRPTKPSPRGRYNQYANRRPTSKEIAACGTWVEKEMALIRPRVIITLGSVPLWKILGKSPRMASYHGRPFAAPQWGCDIFPLYHPAALIYDPKKKTLYENDLEKLKGFLQDLKLLK